MRACTDSDEIFDIFMYNLLNTANIWFSSSNIPLISLHAYVVEIFTKIGERLTGPGTGTKYARSSPHSEQRRLFSKAVFRHIIVEEQLHDCKL